MTHEQPIAGPVAHMTRIGVPLPPDWHGYAMEWLWAAQIPGGQFRLLNSPFYAKGLSWLDVVEADSAEEGWLYARTAEPSGHSTYRLFLLVDAGGDVFRVHWEPLAAIGCTLERATEHLFAVDIPPLTSIEDAYRFLDVGESAGVWDFEEGHVEHPRVPH